MLLHAHGRAPSCYHLGMRGSLLFVVTVAALSVPGVSSFANPGDGKAAPPAKAAGPACPANASLQKIVEPKLASMAIDKKLKTEVTDCLPGSFPKAGWYVEAHVTHGDTVDLYGFIITPPKAIIAAGWVFTLSNGPKSPPITRKVEKVDDRDHDGIDEIYASGTVTNASSGIAKPVANVVKLEKGQLAFSVIDHI